MTRFLLRTEQEFAQFRTLHAKLIQDNADAYVRWVESLPFWEWSPLLLPHGKADVIIGLLCCLLVDGRINITFSRSCTSIMHNPLTDEEYEKAFEAQMAKNVHLKIRNKPSRK